MSVPIFEITTATRHISIYANGVVEGLQEQGTIVNHIGESIRPELFSYFSKSHEDDPCKSPYTSEKPGSSAVGTSHGSGEYGASISEKEHNSPCVTWHAEQRSSSTVD